MSLNLQLDGEAWNVVLADLSRALGKKVITGLDLTILQAVHQFKLYTGVTPSHEAVQRAATFART